jgi:hypothetical protein
MIDMLLPCVLQRERGGEPSSWKGGFIGMGIIETDRSPEGTHFLELA